MRASRLLMVPLVASLVMLISSCKDNTTGPIQVGPGNILEATVDGRKLTFDVASDAANFNTYSVSSNETRFAGGLIGTPGTTMTLRASYDLDKGPFPKTLTGTDVSVIFIEITVDGTFIYNCPLGTNSCSITLTGSDGETVDGTVSADLSESTGQNTTAKITDGKFSVKLRRM
jgi:hypothetical protein